MGVWCHSFIIYVYEMNKLSATATAWCMGSLFFPGHDNFFIGLLTLTDNTCLVSSHIQLTLFITFRLTFVLLRVLGFKPRDSHMLSTHFTIEQSHQPPDWFPWNMFLITLFFCSRTFSGSLFPQNKSANCHLALRSNLILPRLQANQFQTGITLSPCLSEFSWHFCSCFLATLL